MLVAGLDEAGRGPVIGSLTIGCVILEEENLPLLKEIGVDDSKKISPKKRTLLSKKIKENCVKWDIFEVTSDMLNNHHDKGMSLNKIEENYFAELLNKMEPKPDKVYLDAADVKEERFGVSIAKKLTYQPKKIISKHKGDAIFPIVGAASIIAKTERDTIIEDFKKHYGEIGSGYPSDPKTRKFLTSYYEQNMKFPPIVRTFWKTLENIRREIHIKKSQSRLTDF